ncbi:MAG: hypothetical protein J3Q66DRAFT_374846 [Benniella sp.]|nr:MAG: hypothetical protein J3Q66DRAFT_374846 [Benniella sp.]
MEKCFKSFSLLSGFLERRSCKRPELRSTDYRCPVVELGISTRGRCSKVNFESSSSAAIGASLSHSVDSVTLQNALDSSSYAITSAATDGSLSHSQNAVASKNQCSSLDGRSFDVQTFGIGSFGNYSSSFSAAMFGFSSHSQDSSTRSSRKEIRHTLVSRRSHFDFDDDSDSIVTDDTAFDDWDRINILGTELLNVLQTIPRPLFGLDGYISADDSSCRYGVQHVLDNICSWYKSYQQEQGMLELDPADNDELPWKQGECLSEQWQDPDRTILIRAGRLCESTEPRMNPEVMLLHLVEA